MIDFDLTLVFHVMYVVVLLQEIVIVIYQIQSLKNNKLGNEN
jgi:hypothetical protein